MTNMNWFAKIFVALVLIVLIFIYNSTFTSIPANFRRIIGTSDFPLVTDYCRNNTDHEKKKNNESNNNFSMIFIGGYERSGTTLMRAILAAHPNISCGPETKIIPAILEWYVKWRRLWNESESLTQELKDTGLRDEAFNMAMANYIRTIMVFNRENRNNASNSSSKSSNLCSKDPYNARYIKYLQQVFPQMKFILMVRDVRAVAYSYLWRIKTSYFSNQTRELFLSWNTEVDAYVRDCKQVGTDSCLIVIYEQLVENKELVLRKIMRFLDIEWSDSLMKHEKFIGDRILISNSEWSTDQIIKPIYTDSIDAWAGKLSDDVLKLVNSTVSSLLEQLGYDPRANTSVNNKTFI